MDSRQCTLHVLSMCFNDTLYIWISTLGLQRIRFEFNAYQVISLISMEGLGVRKGTWTKEEDDLLKQFIEKHGEVKWHQVPLKAGT